jgi:ribosomal protein S18 acetylase RimI-like enzyme
VTSGEGAGIRRLRPDEWTVLRAVRIAALTDAPEAFGSTLARELAFSEDVWRSRLRDDAGRGYAQLVATFGENVAGTIGLIRSDSHVDIAEMVSTWVAPEARGRGIGDLLVATLVATARDEGYRSVHLWVAEGNDYAERLYARHGFVRMGVVQPIRAEEPDRLEFAMALRDALVS